MTKYMLTVSEITLQGSTLSDVSVTTDHFFADTREEIDAKLKEIYGERAEDIAMGELDWDEDDMPIFDEDDGYAYHEFDIERGYAELSCWSSEGDGTRHEFRVEKVEM